MSDKKHLLLLFDGHALVHRAFHALPALAVTKTGEPTGALYGFASMLLKVLAEYKPTHWAIALDAPGPTFRHEQFEEYKAHRKPAPDELKSQLAKVRELIKAFHAPSFEIPGYEADDIIGTISKKASEQGIDTIIVTGDTDTLQLVSPHVRVLTPKPGRPFSDTVIYDEDGVKQRYELQPKQLADFKGLKGDPSDNIPGVRGIGEKTATKLIQTFGSVEGIYEHLNEVTPPKAQETLRQNQRAARQSKELVTIDTDVPLDFDLNACRVTTYERSKVAELFRDLEFFSLLPKLPDVMAEEEKSVPAEAPTVTKETAHYQIVDTPESLDNVVSALSQAASFSLDVETTGLDPRQSALVGIALSTAPGKAWYLPIGHNSGKQLPLDQVIARLKPLMESHKVTKIAHNGKYDMTVLQKYKVKVENLRFDTMIAAYLLGEKALGLKPLAFSKLGIEMLPITNLIGSGAKQISMAWVDVQKVAEYACADADMTVRLSRFLEPELKKEGLWKLFSEVEMPLLPVLLRMETNGVALDTAKLREMSWNMSERMAKLENEIYKDVGHMFNINSPQQLGVVLYDELKLPRARKTKSGYSTEASVLEALKGVHPIIELLLEYRQLGKLKSTYIDALPALIDPDSGRIHTNFNQSGTTTGRLSSSDPNLQNIPVRTEEGKQVRKAFIAEKDTSLLLAADYSQIDLRALAHLSQDPKLLAAFAHGEDIHAATASQVFGVPLSGVTKDMRRLAKTINFGVIYGMSEYGLEQATELSRQEAAQFIKSYFEKYSGVKEYLDRTKKEAADKGYVQTVLGRRRYIPEINSSNTQVRQAAERMAINMPVQGTSADIIKVAMIQLQNEMDKQGLESKMIIQVHDELLFELPREEEAKLKELVFQIMPNALKLSVPVKVDIKTGRSWGDLE